jgi:hypothetical protein
MKDSLTLQELAIVIAVQQLNPTILNPDFLKYSGIIPSDWELARQPTRTNTGIQLSYQNGVTIIAQANQIIFAEPIATKEVQEIEVAAIAHKCIEALPQIDYRAVGVSLRGHIPFSLQESQTAHDYIFGTLLAPGSWHEFGSAPVQAALRFNYTLEQGRLDLDVTEVRLKLSEQEAIPAVLFAGTFSYAIEARDQPNSLTSVTEAINHWQRDLETFSAIVNDRFLQSTSSAVGTSLAEPTAAVV